jgi:hypothetical protein
MPQNRYQPMKSIMSLNDTNNRSRSVGGGKSKFLEKNSLMNSIDTNEKKSPEIMLKKLSEKIDELENNELLNLEKQNIILGGDLNDITF